MKTNTGVCVRSYPTSPVYVFTNNEAPNIRNSGVLELTTTLRSSFNPEPQWLDDTTLHNYDEGLVRTSVSNEVQDGLRLRTYDQ